MTTPHHQKIHAYHGKTTPHHQEDRCVTPHEVATMDFTTRNAEMLHHQRTEKDTSPGSQSVAQHITISPRKLPNPRSNLRKPLQNTILIVNAVEANLTKTDTPNIAVDRDEVDHPYTGILKGPNGLS